MKKSRVKRPVFLKLVLLTIVPLIIVYTVILYLNYLWSSKNSLDQMKDYLVELTGHHSADLNSQFLEVAQAPEALANLLRVNDIPGQQEMYDILREFIKNNPHIYGMTIAFEPYSFSASRQYFSPYVYRSSEDLINLDLAKSYNYLKEEWYVIPRTAGLPVWSEPYFDEGGGNILMCTYSVPIYLDQKFIGIATADVSLENIKNRMEAIKIMGGYTFIISQTGTYIYHPDPEDVMNETIFGKAELYDFPLMKELGAKMIAGEKGVYPFPDPISGSRKWLVFNPITACHWSLAAVLPEKEILTTVHRQTFRQLAIMVIGLCFMILVILWVSYRITNPIRKLTEMAEKIATGDLNVQLKNIKGKDEIHELAEYFNKMVLDLKHYIKDLTRATREKETIESELRIARNIQVSLIPMIFPPFPDRKEIDLYARNIPAREVAGDFYDFFFLDDDHLAFLIADVSGKGISASLFMAVTKTLINAHAAIGMEPHQILSEVNENLCQDNESAMFVTVFMGILDVSNGELVYCNGGHNPPYIIKDDDQIIQIENTSGMALGVLESAEFSSRSINLKKNDLLYLYTDGVTEAMNEEYQEFSEQRLEDLLERIKNSPSEQIVDLTMSGIKDYIGKAEQSDDITLLVLRYLL